MNTVTGSSAPPTFAATPSPQRQAPTAITTMPSASSLQSGTTPTTTAAPPLQLHSLPRTQGTGRSSRSSWDRLWLDGPPEQTSSDSPRHAFAASSQQSARTGATSTPEPSSTFWLPWDTVATTPTVSSPSLAAPPTLSSRPSRCAACNHYWTSVVTPASISSLSSRSRPSASPQQSTKTLAIGVSSPPRPAWRVGTSSTSFSSYHTRGTTAARPTRTPSSSSHPPRTRSAGRNTTPLPSCARSTMTTSTPITSSRPAKSTTTTASMPLSPSRSTKSTATTSPTPLSPSRPARSTPATTVSISSQTTSRVTPSTHSRTLNTSVSRTAPLPSVPTQKVPKAPFSTRPPPTHPPSGRKTSAPTPNPLSLRSSRHGSKLSVLSKPKKILPATASQLALRCPEILEAIGEWIPIFQAQSGLTDNYVFKPRAMLNCCLVSKFWRMILTPILWRIHDGKAMIGVPHSVLNRNKEHVKVYLDNRWYYRDHMEPPLYSHLQEVNVNNALQAGKVVVRLIGSNNRIKKLEVSNVQLFERPTRDIEGAAGNGGSGTQENHNTHSATNPLGHLQTTLEEFCMAHMLYQGKEFYHLLRAVAGGNLRTLKLNFVSGTFDLQGLVFVSLTRLHLWLDEKMQPGLHDIISRSPRLEHLELNGSTNSYSLDPLIQVLRGAQPEETLSQREERLRVKGPEPRRWLRPQLAILNLHNLHLRNRRGSGPQGRGNDVKFLRLIQACSSIYNKQKKEGHLRSLRELDLPLCVLDDAAREAIEMHSSSLEELRIRVMRGRENIPPLQIERQGQVLRKLLQSCSQLRRLEFWDQNGDEDMSVIMESLIGDHVTDSNHDADGGLNSEHQRRDKQMEGPWNCPGLETLVLKSARMHQILKQTCEEQERRYFDNEEGAGCMRPWVMPKQKWDTTLRDGTGVLLGSHWISFELFEAESVGHEEGDELLSKFLLHISPSRKLIELQLGQLKFIRTVV